MDTEKINQEVFGRENYILTVSRDLSADETDYSSKMVKIRLALMNKYIQSKISDVLDLCCGTGVYLFRIRDRIKSGIGVDYVQKMVFAAQRNKEQINAENIHFIVGNAKQLSCKEKKFDLIYSFSSLYYIPELEKVILEVSRLLKPKAFAILEFGNLLSLNTLVCRAYPECAISCHIKISAMKNIIRNAGLEIIEWRRFQILPLWGNRPALLRPLLHPVWRRIFQQEIKGRMIDEWISGIPFIRDFAFRQTIICRKEKI